MCKYIWLSFPLDINDPRPPAIPKPSIRPLYTIEKDAASVHILEVASHTGTHVDSPQHVIADGLCLADFKPEDFIYTKPAVIEIPLPEATIVMPEHLECHRSRLINCDIALFRFGYGKFRRENPKGFCTDCPGLGVEAAEWLAKECQNLKAVGMDVPSVACIKYLDQTMACHNVLLAGKNRKFIIIEDMNLSADFSKLVEVRINPWLVNGMDSGPCSITGVFA